MPYNTRFSFLLPAIASGIGLLGLCCGCAEREVAEVAAPEPAEQKTPAPPVAEPAAETALPSEPAAEVSTQLSEDDLGLGNLPPKRPEGSTTVNSAEADAPPILKEAHEIVERYDDETVKRRYFVRLYVTFDRSRRWDRQPRGSWVEHGAYEEFYPGGKQRLAQGEYRDGKRHGQWTYYHPSGEIAKQGNYNDAQLDGQWDYFRTDGTRLRTENYDAHQKHGVWKYYDADGETVIREVTYDHDERVNR